MSETVHYTGKVKLVERLPNETFEEQCKRIAMKHGFSEAMTEDYYESWAETVYQELYGEYAVTEDKVYEILESKELDPDYAFNAYENPDGTISYDVIYYNGGCGLAEAIEEALKKIS